jgi:hypothetical protein
MERVDFYSGEPVNEYGAQTEDEKIAEEFASFGRTYYEELRANNVNPGAYNNNYGGWNQPNYNMNPYAYNNGWNNGWNQNYNYGWNNQYVPGYQNYNMGNPAYAYMQQMGMQPYSYQQQNVPQGDITYDIPGLSFGNDYLPPAGYEDTIAEMEQEFLRERIENEAKAVVNNFQRNQYGANGYNNGYNYYGTPYHNPYTYTDYNKYQTRLDEMKEEARERRIRLNINLSKLAHNVCGETYDENVIEEIYRGKTITVPGVTYTDLYEYNRLQSLVPVNNADYYRQLDAAVSADYHKYISKDANMQETFENMGLVWNEYEREEEKHRRRLIAGSCYDSNAYNYRLLKNDIERIAKEKGIIIPTAYDSNGDMICTSSNENIRNTFDELKRAALEEFPSLAESAHLDKNGVLHINYKDPTTSNNNTEESKYLKDRDRFFRFLGSMQKTVFNVLED